MNNFESMEYDVFFKYKIIPILKKYPLKLNKDSIHSINCCLFLAVIFSIKLIILRHFNVYVWLCAYAFLLFILILSLADTIRSEPSFELFSEVVTALYEDDVTAEKILRDEGLDCNFIGKYNHLSSLEKKLVKNNKNINGKSISIYQIYSYEKDNFTARQNLVLFDGILIKMQLPIGITNDFVSLKRKKKFNLFNIFGIDHDFQYNKIIIPNKKLNKIYSLYAEVPQNASLLLSGLFDLIKKYPGRVFFSVENGVLNVGLNDLRFDTILLNNKYKKNLKFFIDAMTVLEKINNEGFS